MWLTALATALLVTEVESRIKTDEAAGRAQGFAVLQTPHYRLHYDPAFVADAKKVQDYLDRGIAALKKEFAGHKPDALLEGIDCNIFLHPRPTDKASEHTATLMTGVFGDKYRAELDLLTPSAYGPGFRSHVGEAAGEDYFRKLVVHEYSTIFLERITRAKKGGWRFFSAPAWFVQGYEEYLGLTCSSPQNRAVVLPKYLQRQKGEPGRVVFGFGIGIADPYLDGPALMHFMHEEFGKERVQAILTSREPVFEVAIAKALGVSLEEFRQRWEAWRMKLP